MKKISSALILVGVVLTAAIVTRSAWAASTANVVATVTAQNISVSVGNGTINYGAIAANSSRGTVSMAGSTQSATNSGNIAETFTIHGSDGTIWRLDASSNATQDHYTHKFCTSSCATPPTNYTAITTGETTLATNVAASAAVPFDLYITTPQTSSTYLSQNVDVTITATAY